MEPLLPAVILLAVVAAIEGSQTVLGFLPLGATGAVTTNLQARDNAVSGAIPTGGSFPYSSGHVNTAYVSENGAISFGSSRSMPPQSPGPSLLQDAGETLIVAPFWTDYAVGGGGSVKYEAGNAQERLDMFSRFVVNRTNYLEAFDASWMILVEWRDRLPQGSTNTSLSNTFQALVGTDNSNHSFAIFIYQCDLIRWPGPDSNYAKIGTSMGGGMEQVHELSGMESAENIDCVSDNGMEIVNVIYDLTQQVEVIRPVSTAISMMPVPSTVTSSAAPVTPVHSTVTSSVAPAMATTRLATTSSESRIQIVTSVVLFSPTSTHTPTVSTTGASLSTPIVVVVIVIPLLVVALLIVAAVAVFITVMKKKSGKKNRVEAVTPLHVTESLKKEHRLNSSPFHYSGHSSVISTPPDLVPLGRVGESPDLNHSQAPLIETEINSPVSIHPQSP